MPLQPAQVRPAPLPSLDSLVRVGQTHVGRGVFARRRLRADVMLDSIVAVTMWSEVFARCDDPPVTVRWSDPVASAGAAAVVPTAWVVNYQSHAEGGCANTDSSVDDIGALQRTSVRRTTRQGTHLPVPPA